MKLEKNIFGFFKSCSLWKFEKIRERKRENETMVCGKNGVFWETVNCKDIQTRNSILKHHFLAKKNSPVSFQEQL